jgi:hypothetical protein
MHIIIIDCIVHSSTAPPNDTAIPAASLLGMPRVTEVAAVLWPVRTFGGVRALDPGISFAVAVAAVATLLGRLAPVVGAPVFAVLADSAIAVARKPAARLRPGIAFTSKKVLQGSIVLMGLGLSLGQVLSTGARGYGYRSAGVAGYSRCGFWVPPGWHAASSPHRPLAGISSLQRRRWDG